MKVKITQLGWAATPKEYEWIKPCGYVGYLCEAANGIICKRYIWADAGFIPSGEYELPDADWSYDNPRWDRDYDMIEQG